MVAPCYMVPVVPAWQACVSARLGGVTCIVLCWGRRRQEQGMVSSIRSWRASALWRSLLLSYKSKQTENDG